MDVLTINVQITKNPRQYEAVRLGMEATVNRNDTAEEAIKEATRRLNELYDEMYTQKTKDGAEGKKTQASPAPSPTCAAKFPWWMPCVMRAASVNLWTSLM